MFNRLQLQYVATFLWSYPVPSRVFKRTPYVDPLFYSTCIGDTYLRLQTTYNWTEKCFSIEKGCMQHNRMDRITFVLMPHS